MGPNQGKETAMSPTKSLPEKKVVCCMLSKMRKRMYRVSEFPKGLVLVLVVVIFRVDQ